MEEKDLDKIIENLTTEDLVGQTICLDISNKDTPDQIEKIIKHIKPGGLFMSNTTTERIRIFTDIANKYAKIPVIVSSDVEDGPGGAVAGTGMLPQPMAWGACDDPELIREAGKITGKICRRNGIHWTFAPVVDLNINFRSPECNIRAISDDPDEVIKIAGAYIEGLEDNNDVIATCKHFPGQGIDERNSHFCNSINSLSEDEWMNTYGKVYKAMFKMGVSAVMIGHVSFPAVEEEIDPVSGPLPAGLSYSIMTKFLKGKLGFNGCIVSDAMSMIGIAAAEPDITKIGVNFLKAGGDMILFPHPDDYDNILKAVNDGSLSKDRLKDAAKRVLKLKVKAHITEDDREYNEKISVDADINVISQKIADKSIKVVRDYNKIIPCNIENGKILFINILEPFFHKEPSGHEFDAMKEEFEKYGHTVDIRYNPKHTELQKIMYDYDIIVINCKMSSKDYHGATLRMGWNALMPLWRAYVLQHPRCIFVSFGDPYKLFDMPYLKEYINAFSNSPSSQRAAAKVILGKIKPSAKNPIAFKGFFEREV